MDARSTHCSYCGAQFSGPAWPRTCAGCGRMSFVNPLPVAVLLLPIDSGVLLIRRSIEPQRGHLALPGGFIDLGESWQHAAARELREETGVEIDPITVRHFRTVSSEDGHLILIFGEGPKLRESELIAFTPTAETEERSIVFGPTQLAFPLHTAVLDAYFARGAPQ